MPKPGDLKVPKVNADSIKDPKLKPPKKKDLKLGLDRSAKDSLDQFSKGPKDNAEKTEAAGNFESRGLGLGSGASLVPTMEPIDQPDAANADDVVDAKDGAEAGVANPELPEVEQEISPQPMDAEVSTPEDMTEPAIAEQQPSLNLESLLASFAAVRVRLDEFDAALSLSVARLQMHKLLVKVSRTM